MCSEHRRGTPREVLENLRRPMPLRRKVKLFLRNNWLKIRTRSDCCGNYGEPGC
ncbi:MAG: hypothetical protein JXM69_10665 [Anaerolineae bacterium]|nr:hypothetical protein [Anaerolineae bacterium]